MKINKHRPQRMNAGNEQHPINKYSCPFCGHIIDGNIPKCPQCHKKINWGYED